MKSVSDFFKWKATTLADQTELDVLARALARCCSWSSSDPLGSGAKSQKLIREAFEAFDVPERTQEKFFKFRDLRSTGRHASEGHVRCSNVTLVFCAVLRFGH